MTPGAEPSPHSSLRHTDALVSAAGVALGTVIAMITLTPMMRGLTGEFPHVPPLLYAAFATTAAALTLAAVTLPARTALRTRHG